MPVPDRSDKTTDDLVISAKKLHDAKVRIAKDQGEPVPVDDFSDKKTEKAMENESSKADPNDDNEDRAKVVNAFDPRLAGIFEKARTLLEKGSPVVCKENGEPKITKRGNGYRFLRIRAKAGIPRNSLIVGPNAGDG